MERAEVAGPGFVNLWLSDEWHAAALEAILGAGERYGAFQPSAKRATVRRVRFSPEPPIQSGSRACRGLGLFGAFTRR